MSRTRDCVALDISRPSLLDDVERVEMKLLRQPNKARNDVQARKKRSATLKNVSQFYAYVYGALFGGDVMPPYRTEVEKIANGLPRNFHPDLVRKTRNGQHYTEIKAASTRNYLYFCGTRQLENLAYKLLSSNKNPRVDYAFFLYGGWKEGLHVNEVSNEDLVRRLCGETRQLVVMPINLAMYLFLTSRKQIYDHTSSDGTDREGYWQVAPRRVRLIANAGVDALRKDTQITGVFCERSKRIADELLGLDDLVQTTHLSSERGTMSVGGHEMQDFPITHVKMQQRAYERWLKRFRKNHDELLREALYIDDIYEKQKELPF